MRKLHRMAKDEGARRIHTIKQYQDVHPWHVLVGRDTETTESTAAWGRLEYNTAVAEAGAGWPRESRP